MSLTRAFTYACDRCGAEEVFDDQTPPFGWLALGPASSPDLGFYCSWLCVVTAAAHALTEPEEEGPSSIPLDHDHQAPAPEDHDTATDEAPPEPDVE